MAWTTPKTYTGVPLTSAEMNTYQRDNLLETAPAKATAADELFESTGANAIAATQTPMATMLQAIIYG